jgi:hypothetical protein
MPSASHAELAGARFWSIRPRLGLTGHVSDLYAERDLGHRRRLIGGCGLGADGERQVALWMSPPPKPAAICSTALSPIPDA